MNGAFLHLAINHIPVIGVPFAFFLLATGLIRHSKDLVYAGFVTLILMGLGAYPIVVTGSMAARMVHGFPDIARGSIHEHAEAADFGFWGAIGLGVISLIGFWRTAKNQDISKVWTLIALVGSLWLTTVMLRVAHLGGLIRHPEVAPNFAPPSSSDAKEADDDDAPAMKVSPKPLH